MTAYVRTGLLALAMTLAAAGAADEKIAVVDMGKLIGAHPAKESAEALLQKQLDDFEAEQKAMDADREKIKEAFDKIRAEADNKALSEEARDAKVKEAEQKILEMRQLERKSRDTAMNRRQQLADEKKRMQGQVVSKIRELIQELAKKKGYVLVLDSASIGMQGVEGVVYFEPAMDITDDILKMIEKQKD